MKKSSGFIKIQLLSLLSLCLQNLTWILQLRNHYDGPGSSRRGGRGGGVGPGRRPGAPGSHQQHHQGHGGPGDMGGESGMSGGSGGPPGSTRRNIRGVPQVVPEFSPTTESLPPNQDSGVGGLGRTGSTSTLPNPLGLFSKANPLAGSSSATNNQGQAGAAGTSANANPLTGKLPGVFSETPNFMQKFTEFTNSANTGDSILSKGKELIFKKFGL